MTADLQKAGIKTWDLKDVEIEVQNMVATYALHYPEAKLIPGKLKQIKLCFILT